MRAHGGEGRGGPDVDNITSNISSRMSDYRINDASTATASSPRTQISSAPQVRGDTCKTTTTTSSPREGNIAINSGNPESSSTSRNVNSRRGGRKKKNGRIDSRPNSRAGDKKARNGGGGPRALILPHTKLTIRRIRDVDKFGSPDQMAKLLSSVFLSAKSALTETSYSVVLDEPSLQRCCSTPAADANEEELTEEPEREQPPEEQLQDHVNDTKAAENNISADIVVSTVSPPEPEVETIATLTEKEKGNIHILITAKTLYLIPPRKSRRRGIITGHIYLVLNPTIQHTPYNKMSNFERSKTVATARLALQSFQTILSSSASSTSTTPPIVLERSPNQKTFYTDKQQRTSYFRPSPLEGSLSQTDDYQSFLQDRLQFQEDLKNRPKPQPGGGFLDTVTTTTILSKEDSNEEKKDLPQNKQTVSALVLYLQKKKEMASYSKKKSAMKLNTSSKSSKKKKKKDMKNSSSGTGKSKKDFKKKGPNSGSSIAAGNKASSAKTVTPRAILKS